MLPECLSPYTWTVYFTAVYRKRLRHAYPAVQKSHVKWWSFWVLSFGTPLYVAFCICVGKQVLLQNWYITVTVLLLLVNEAYILWRYILICSFILTIAVLKWFCMILCSFIVCLRGSWIQLCAWYVVPTCSAVGKVYAVHIFAMLGVIVEWEMSVANVVYCMVSVSTGFICCHNCSRGIWLPHCEQQNAPLHSYKSQYV